jgi:hypothetical protein
MALYQVKMALNFLDCYAKSEPEKKLTLESKFKRHAGNIDQAFRTVDLVTDLENIKAQLQAILGIREKATLMEREEHSKRSSQFFLKSLDQKFYSAVYADKITSQEILKEMLELRQLHYEAVLHKPVQELVEQFEIEKCCQDL